MVTREILNSFDMVYPNHVHLVCGPLYHSAPMSFATMSHAIGATVVVMYKFQPERALKLMAQHRVTSTFMAPTLLKMILSLPEPVLRAQLPRVAMRNILIGAAPCAISLKAQAMACFGQVLFEFYGSSELGINTVLRPEDQLRKPGSCGRPTSFCTVRLVSLQRPDEEVPTGGEGLLQVRRTESVADEYYNAPEKTRQLFSQDGLWATVHDVARFDDEGFLYICDRAIDMVISGGVNIYPREVEDAMHQHPAVLDVAVFGVPDATWGERLHAAVVLKEGAALTADALIAFTKTQLADYKVPREISFHLPLEFPRDNAGKIRKNILKLPFWKHIQSKI